MVALGGIASTTALISAKRRDLSRLITGHPCRNLLMLSQPKLRPHGAGVPLLPLRRADVEPVQLAGDVPQAPPFGPPAVDERQRLGRRLDGLLCGSGNDG